MTQLTSPHDTASAINSLSAEQDTPLSAVQAAVPVFKQQKGFTTFTAEYALVEGAIVIHFFPPYDRQVTQQYWRSDFADVLVQIAPEYFNATAPRLVASYTEEMKSWWVRAKDFDHILALDGYVYRFLELMDVALDAKLNTDR